MKTVLINKKVKHDYQIIKEYTCGLSLFGSEVKSIRQNKVSIKNGYISIKNNEAFLKNVNISKYEQSNIFNHEELRDRKLLLKKKEILEIYQAIKLGKVVVPYKLVFKNNYIKVIIILGTKLKKYDKREKLKEKSLKDQIAKAVKKSF